MTYFLINPRFPREYREKISSFGKCLPVPEFELLDFPVNTHPDMQAVNLMGRLFIHRENTALASLLASHGISFSAVDDKVSALYPGDISLNLFTAENCLFANTAYASAQVLEYASQNGFRACSVRQGYAKCSAMTLGGAIVTADTSIHKSADREGVPSLLIRPGSIGIEKYDTGFIGGASAQISANKIAVFGNILAHPDGEKILSFAKANGADILSLGEGALFDYGGIVRVDT